MSPRQPPPARPASRAVPLSVALSLVAAVLAGIALLVVLVRTPGQDPQAGAGPDGCRTAAWGAIPSVSALPPGWSAVSTRFFVDNASLTLAAPSASGATSASSVYLSVSCFGTDAALALSRSYDAAIAAGGTAVSYPTYGDETRAVASARTSSTTISIRRGILVADITAATSLDAVSLQAVVGAVDAAMADAVSASPRPSAAAASPGGASPAATVAIAPPSALPSASAPPVSHVAPVLEALLPHAIEGSTLVSQSILGTTALQDDATSKSLLASLTKLGKTAADLEIAEAHDPAGKLQVRLYGFHAEGVKGADLSAAIVASWMVNTEGEPKQSDLTLGKHVLTKVSYVQGFSDYLYASGDIVIAIETSDEGLVAKVVALLK